jgi:outer membrane protein OmpA-like peptidoglycan-associated protein
MHRFLPSFLAFFVIYGALGDVRLPVVNVAAAGVSARAAFGEESVPTPSQTVTVAPVARPVAKKTRSVVARPAAKPTTVQRGEKLTTADVLVPHRPSADLWASNETPLRMPRPSEFAVLNDDFDLPEESIDHVATTTPKTVVARNTTPVTKRESMAAIDNQIAKLRELQRRADESVGARPSQIVAEPITPIVADAKVATPENPTVKLSRMVVPMDDDVVVRPVEKTSSAKIADVRRDMTSMSPTELRRAFRKTFLSENKHLSTFQIDDRFDTASDMSKSVEGFTAVRDLSEAGGIRPLEIKIRFRNDDSSLSRDNYTLLTEYASIVVSNPKRAIQVAIPTDVTTDADSRKLAARRLAIIEQVLRDTGVSEQRILPVLADRGDDGFLLRIISNEQYETLTQQQRNAAGKTIGSKTYRSMSW